MKPRSPFISPLSSLLTVLLLTLLGASIWFQGGSAFSPGKVTAYSAANQVLGGYGSHAEFEARCSLCHPSIGMEQSQLCNQCHTGIADQMKDPAALHGTLPTPVRCFDCHPEHRGRSFNPREYALLEFDHSLTAFPLDGEHQALACADCHPAGRYLTAAQDCSGCHQVPEVHPEATGIPCSACHTTRAWLPAAFDHLAVGAVDCLVCHTGDRPADHFAGQCSACHTTQAWEPASFDHAMAQATDCLACHTPPPAHFAGQCSLCHSTTSWSGVTFTHTFPVDHGDANGECAACHPAGNETWTCFSCHDQAEMNREHNEVFDFSSNCLACHPDGSEGGEGNREGGGDD